MSKDGNGDRGVSNYFVYDFIKATAAIPGMIWFRPKVRYISPAAKEKLRGGVLLVSNHTGFMDPVCLMFAIWYRRHHFVCLDRFFEGTVKRWFFTRFHCIPINRDNLSLDALRPITEELKKEHLVTMFPEGHVTGNENMAPFKSGMILLAMQSGKPIVPVYMKKRKHWYSRVIAGVGEKVNVREELGGRPSLTKINEMTKRLEAAEEELARLVG